MKRKLFKYKTALDEQLAKDILHALHVRMHEKATASILFSGGSTPKGLLETLANADFPWHKVKVGLVDDRMVEPTSEHLNANMIQDLFLNKIKGEKPQFLPLVHPTLTGSENLDFALKTIDEIGVPDVVVLGMGGDGHFASLFPSDAASAEGLEVSYEQPLLYTQAPAVPKTRISHSWSYLRKAPFLFLHLTGEAKLDVLKGHQDRTNTLPIDTVLSDTDTQKTLYWAP